jgi:mannose-6-phosphate isomerase-like protein (cupin superfamily)
MQSPKPYREKRPWGEFVRFTQNTPSTVKIITILPGEELSLQRHKMREEFWHVISGNGTGIVGDTTMPLRPGTECFVPKETNHRLEAGTELLTVLEISFGDFDENDIVHIEDKYGRRT